MSVDWMSRRKILQHLAGAAGVAATLPRLSSAGQTPAATTRSGSKHWDVLVVGAGVFGSWVAWELLKRKRRVLLVDAWGAANTQGSSGGESRLIRTEYGGDELYTQMAWESLPRWQELSSHARMPIFLPTGAIYLLEHEPPEVATSMTLHARLGIPMQRLSSEEIKKRYPQIATAGITSAVLQPTMGALMARRAVQTLVARFVADGGDYRVANVQPPRPGATLAEVVTAQGERLQAEQIVFACGAWLPKLFPDVIGSRIVPSRQEVMFFAPEGGDVRYSPEHLPVWVDLHDSVLHYGFPALEERGFKLAYDAHGPRFDPDQGDRQIAAEAVAKARAYLAKRFPGMARRPLIETRVCPYENSTNGDFIIDRHPGGGHVWIVGGGSGHGFKHGPAVGRYTAELITEGARKPEPRFSIASRAAQGASA